MDPPFGPSPWTTYGPGPWTPYFSDQKKRKNNKQNLVKSNKELSYIKAPSVYLLRKKRLRTDNRCLHEVFIVEPTCVASVDISVMMDTEDGN